jgi:plasmid stabilization system protein ParE
MKYRVKILDTAKADKKNIKKYLKRYYPGTAERFIKKLKTCVENIKEMPYMSPRIITVIEG